MSDAASPPQEPSTAADRDAESIADAARRAIDHWLRKTVRLVKRCARHSPQDAEEIHRLRVAIRHVDAALITFDSLLPGRKCRRLRKRLRRLRRKAGEIRDIDVLLDRVAGCGGSNGATAPEPGADLSEDRRSLSLELRAAARNEIDDHLKRRTRRIVDRTRWRGAGTAPLLSAAAAEFLTRVAADARKYGARDLSELKRLHRFRVGLKRLRYAVEFLQAGLPGGPVVELQAVLSGLQQRLGDMCDHAAAVQLLAAERESPRGAASAAALDELIEREQALLATQQAGFVAWWNNAGRMQLERSIGACLA
jgi:CHAD domain-containing protein